MSKRTFDVKTMANLLGCLRSDKQVKDFIDRIESTPTFYVDKEDGAYEEYIEFKDLGFCLYFDHDFLNSIFLFSKENDQGYACYSCPLPMGMKFEQSKSDVMKSCGSPEIEGGGHDNFFGDIPPWIKYQIDSHTVHIEFTPDTKRVSMITLAPGEVVTQ